MTQICRIITDDRVGNINPALALAEEIAKFYPIQIQQVTVQQTRLARLVPHFLLRYFAHSVWLHYLFNLAPNPEVVLTIGNGSASIVPCYLLSLLEKKSNFNGLFVQLQNPRVPACSFDYVICPTHDFIRGTNVIPTIGSLSRVQNILTAQGDAQIIIPFEFNELPRPIIAVFIGGENGRFKFNRQDAIKLAHYLLSYNVANNASLIITTSRRTGKKNEAILRNILKGDNIIFPDSSQDNPYYAMLKQADAAIVTCDSVNMISDCVTAGLPTYIYELSGDSGKFEHFYNSLKRRKLLYDLEADYKPRTIEQFDETNRVAKIIAEALRKKQNND